MDARRILDKAGMVLWLLALGYLGFWVYGLVMSVFEPGQMIGFSVVALAIIAMLVVQVVRSRQSHAELIQDDEFAQASRHQREVRGF
jgi:hypothetical protein